MPRVRVRRLARQTLYPFFFLFFLFFIFFPRVLVGVAPRERLAVLPVHAQVPSVTSLPGSLRQEKCSTEVVCVPACRSCFLTHRTTLMKLCNSVHSASAAAAPATAAAAAKAAAAAAAAPVGLLLLLRRQPTPYRPHTLPQSRTIKRDRSGREGDGLKKQTKDGIRRVMPYVRVIALGWHRGQETLAGLKGRRRKLRLSWGDLDQQKKPPVYQTDNIFKNFFH